jgi:hypothetical protein
VHSVLERVDWPSIGLGGEVSEAGKQQEERSNGFHEVVLVQAREHIA